jgi:hypothetical protein
MMGLKSSVFTGYASSATMTTFYDLRNFIAAVAMVFPKRVLS